ncbi:MULTISPECIES: FdtA/QdtA family cupin domain-containing protein [unclassified Caballeronia]|uniref:sugar 3,4-ketoisomerase n=1 Tax=unclassified Caballeronia TaxID=2646786 RepID=UPI00158BA2B3|nr:MULTISPECIES: FdtA/QdtA family cupin domain-containing protein [unclassified Caballeronia]QSN60687.1 WxcM-like domain-containing protein [Caballeronia sp. M1242]
MRWNVSFSVEECRFIELPQFADRRGNLSFVQEGDVPFDFRRLYYLYDVPFGVERAGHAHKNLHQLFFAFAGSYELHLDDGVNTRTVVINQPNRPFYVCPHIWRVVNNFTSGAVCAVLASETYSESDYLRTYDGFLDFLREIGKPIKSDLA